MNDNNYKPTMPEAIDACRPGYDDLAMSEMSELADRASRDAQLLDVAERSQRLDLAIGQAFQDVQVPPGLADHLLANLTVSDCDSASDPLDVSPHAQDDGAVKVTTAERGDSGSRRWYRRMILRGTLALSLVVGIFAVAQFSPDPPIPKSDLQKMVLAWVNDLPRNSWNQDIGAVLADYSLPTSLSKNVVARQWQYFDAGFGEAVVYDLTRPGKRFVFVFVIPTQSEFQGVGAALSSIQPDSTTGNRCLGFAWNKSKKVLYVLVVEGQDVNRYRSLFNQQPVI